MTILYKVIACNGYHNVQYGDNFKSFEEAEEYIKKSKCFGTPPFIIAERVPERVFPKTSLTESELRDVYYSDDVDHGVAFTAVANAAIKQYILDKENKGE